MKAKGGDKQSKNTKATDRASRQWRPMIIAVVVVLVIACVGGALFIANNIRQESTGPTDDEIIAELTNKPESIADQTKVIAEARASDAVNEAIKGLYSEEFWSYYESLNDTNPASWSSDDVLKAHFCVAYADRVELSSQLETVIFELEFASNNGVTVYGDNFYYSSDAISNLKQE